MAKGTNPAMTGPFSTPVWTRCQRTVAAYAASPGPATLFATREAYADWLLDMLDPSQRYWIPRLCDLLAHDLAAIHEGSTP